MKRLKLCANYINSLPGRFSNSRYVSSSCRYLKMLVRGRYSRRMTAVAIVLTVMILLVFHLNENALQTVAPVLAVLVSGLIGYGAFLDEKRFEKLYDSKLELYRKMLNEILYIYRLPILFLHSDANNIPVEELKNAAKDVNSGLNMLLLSNAESYSALSSLEKRFERSCMR